jgi:hypothetical protein
LKSSNKERILANTYFILKCWSLVGPPFDQNKSDSLENYLNKSKLSLFLRARPSFLPPPPGQPTFSRHSLRAPPSLPGRVLPLLARRPTAAHLCRAHPLPVARTPPPAPPPSTRLPRSDPHPRPPLLTVSPAPRPFPSFFPLPHHRCQGAAVAFPVSRGAGHSSAHDTVLIPDEAHGPLRFAGEPLPCQSRSCHRCRAPPSGEPHPPTILHVTPPGV